MKKFTYIIYSVLTCVLVSCTEEPEPILEQIDEARSIYVQDIRNQGNPSDLSVAFSRASDESNIQEYRILIRSTSSNEVMNLSLANNASPESYQSISPSGSNITLDLISDIKTIDYEELKEDAFYLLYVLSVSNSDEYRNRLSAPSNAFKFSTKADPAKSLYLSDIGNTGTITDFQLAFSPALDEDKINAYRAIIVKETEINDFSIEEASSLSADRYIQVTPSGSDYLVNFSQLQLDSDGDPIDNSQKYVASVFSVEDGNNALLPELSKASNAVQLENRSFVRTVTEPFQGGGGLSYHHDGYLVSGNTNGSFRNSLGDGVVHISTDTYEVSISNTELSNCSGNSYLSNTSEILQVTKGGVYKLGIDGSSSLFAEPINIGNMIRLGFPTDVCANSQGRIFASNCDPSEIYELTQNLFGFVSVNTIEFDNSNRFINCPRYIDINNQGDILVMNAFDNRIFIIPTQSTTSEPQLFFQLPSDFFLSFTNVPSRNAVYATTTGNKIVSIHNLSKKLDSVAGTGAESIVDGDLDECSFKNPINIVADTTGNKLFVLDEIEPTEGISVLRLIELVE